MHIINIYIIYCTTVDDDDDDGVAYFCLICGTAAIYIKAALIFISARHSFVPPPIIYIFTSATTSSLISTSTATFNPGQKRPPPPSTGTQPNSVQHLQQLLSASNTSSSSFCYSALSSSHAAAASPSPLLQHHQLQHSSCASASPLFTTLADATLLQNSAIVNEALKTLGSTFQQQEIVAAKRIRFGGPAALATLAAPPFVPVNNNFNNHPSLITPYTTQSPASVAAAIVAAAAGVTPTPTFITPNPNPNPNNNNVKQQQMAAVLSSQQQQNLDAVGVATGTPPTTTTTDVVIAAEQQQQQQQQQQQLLVVMPNNNDDNNNDNENSFDNNQMNGVGTNGYTKQRHHHNSNGGTVPPPPPPTTTTTTTTAVVVANGVKDLCGTDFVRFTPADHHQQQQQFQLDPTGGGAIALHCLNNGSSLSQSYQDLSTGVQAQPNSILRIIIDYMLYPVTLDVLYLIFSRYGKVLRIITFNKNNLFQALIQLSEASSAQNAKNSLDGLNIYNGCCTLHIEYSKLSSLNVKWNNDKSRDYTNPNLPSGDLTYEQKLQLLLQNVQASNGLSAAMIPLTNPSATPTNHHQFPFNAIALPQTAANLAQNAAAAVAQILPTNLAGIMLNGAAAAAAASAAAVNPSNNPSAPIAQFQTAGTPVVLVSNLDETAVTPEQLFLLFGVYGDVIRVKILFNKKNNALVQYADVQQAQLAIQHLDRVKWNGKNMRVTASKHVVVQMPKEGQPDAGLTKEYLNSSLHRFKKPGSKNYMNIYPPSSTLHLSNIPCGITEDAMLQIFQHFKIVEFKFFQKDHKMALLQLDDVESAIHFLVTMHNYKLAENAHLRVSFSKKGING